MDLLSRALSLRVIGSSLLTGLLGGVVVGLVWPAAEMPALWIVAAGMYVLTVAASWQMVKCDDCGKRVKVGSAVCHHCGYSRG